MSRRLATICLMTMFLPGLISRPVRAQDTASARASLKGISTVYVVVEKLSDGAMKLGLSADMIQTDVETKLRLAGLRVVTEEDRAKRPGTPYVYVGIAVTNDAQAAYIEVALSQPVRLQQNNQITSAVTWNTEALASKPNAQGTRDAIMNRVDKFLNAWLSVNPKT